MPDNGKQVDDSNVCQAGFSLLELVLVVAIISVMAAIATPRFGAAHARYRVDLAARRIAADIAYAQMVARRNSTRQEIIFDIASDSYTLPGVADIDRPVTDYAVDLADTKYRVDLVSASFENADGYISTDRMSFTMWGSPQSGHPSGGHPFAALVDGSVVIALGSESRTINIAPVTGTVSIQ
jgi:type II secretion system protein H